MILIDSRIPSILLGTRTGRAFVFLSVSLLLSTFLSFVNRSRTILRGILVALLRDRMHVIIGEPTTLSPCALNDSRDIVLYRRDCVDKSDQGDLDHRGS